jgi:hypothetical protein
MAQYSVTLTRTGGRLRARAVCSDTATAYSAEFSDSLPGAIGLSRFLAMLHTASGCPVPVAAETKAASAAVNAVLAGEHPPTRYDGRYRSELQKGAKP